MTSEHNYLDHNATTPVDERVLEAMLPFLQGTYGNASSRHEHGRVARAAVDAAREQVADAVGAQASQVVFTSSGTEANNTIIKGIAAVDDRARLCIGALEHPCVLCSARTAAKDERHQMVPISCTSQGSYELNDLKDSAAAGQTAVVSLMLANNETGVIQDIAAATQIAKAAGAVMHTDAVQALGKIPVSFAELGVDAMTISAHKARGPKGVAALLSKRDFEWQPLLEGGGHEAGMRSSTENVAGIVGFGVAAQLAKDSVQASGKLAKMRDALEDKVLAAGAICFGREAQRLPNTSYFAFPGIDGETLVMMLDQARFSISSGSACSNLKDDESHVLLAMDVDASLARCAVRVSLGPETTEQICDTFVATTVQLVERLRSMASIVA